MATTTFDPIKAAHYLAEAHVQRSDYANLPEAIAPSTITDAYLVQDALREIWTPARGAIAGYKIATTTKVMQALMGIDHPCQGNIFAKTVHASPAKLRLADYINLVIECELCVRLGSTLDAKTPYTAETVAGAIKGLIPAFELIKDRRANYKQTKVHTLIADNAVFDYIQNNAQLYGGEIGLHFHPHPLDWLHFESSFETVTGKKQDGDYLPLIPANKWNSTLKTEFKDTNWLKESFASFNVEYILDQNNIGTFETKTNDYALLNLALGGKIKFTKVAMDISCNVNNLLNRNYISHLSRLKTEGIPNMGRNVVFGVNFSI